MTVAPTTAARTITPSSKPAVKKGDRVKIVDGSQLAPLASDGEHAYHADAAAKPRAQLRARGLWGALENTRS